MRQGALHNLGDGGAGQFLGSFDASSHSEPGMSSEMWRRWSIRGAKGPCHLISQEVSSFRNLSALKMPSDLYPQKIVDALPPEGEAASALGCGCSISVPPRPVH